MPIRLNTQAKIWRHKTVCATPIRLFIPGGPGISYRYLTGLTQNPMLPGTNYVLEFPHVHKNRSQNPNDVMQTWVDSVAEAVEVLAPDSVIGHSFGGMVLLSTPNISSRLKNVILMSSAPDSTWRRILPKASKLLDQRSETLQRNFDSMPTSKNLRKLFVSWTPLYFSPESYRLGGKFLNSLNYSAKDFKIGRIFNLQYRCIWTKSKFRILCISGENDQLTPTSLFSRSGWKERLGITKIVTIPRAGHFPWVERPLEVCQSLTKFEHCVI